MFTRIYAIAQLSFREAIRAKILYAVAFFVLFILLFSLVLGELSLNEQERVIKDVGILFLSIVSVGLALFTTISNFHNELSKKTIYTVLSKPVPRSELILGKFLGISATLFIEITAMTAAFLALLAIQSHPIQPTLLIAIILIYFQTLVLIAFSLLFATFSSLVLNTLLALSFYILASLHSSITTYAQEQSSKLLISSMKATQFLLPNLSLFNISTQVTYNIHIPLSYLILCILHALTYIALTLTLASFIFNKRDFI